MVHEARPTIKIKESGILRLKNTPNANPTNTNAPMELISLLN